MMVKFRQLLNPVILNAEMVDFAGDSEYVDENGELQMGGWEFLALLEKEPTKHDWRLDDEIDNSILHDRTSSLPDGRWLFKIVNDNGKLCVVKFKY